MEPPPFQDVKVFPELRRYIRRVIVTETGPTSPHAAMIAPTGYAYVGWVFRGTMATFVDDHPHATFTQPSVFIGGALNTEWVRVEYSQRYGQILAEFTATGLFELLHVRGSQVAGIACHAEDLGLDGFAGHTKAAKEPQVGAYAAKAFQQTLCAFIPKAARASDYVRRAVDLFEAANGDVRIKDVAEAVGIRQDRLRRQFRDVVGLKPKSFVGALMLNQAMEILVGQKSGSLTDLAHAAGFYDQAHFIRAVRKMAKESPGAYVASLRRFPDALFVRDPK